jgi:hypothetical protein
VFLLGTCVLLPVLDAAVAGVDSQVTADALIGAFSTEYRCEQPGDDEVLRRIKGHGGDALENLARLPFSSRCPDGLASRPQLAPRPHLPRHRAVACSDRCSAADIV